MLACLRGSSKDKSLPSPDDDDDFSVETSNFAPQHLLIKVDSFSSLCVNGISKYESREFIAGDHKWKLTFCPNLKEFCGDVSVYLSAVETSSRPVDWEVNATFTIFLFNQILDNYICFRGKKIRRFHEMNPKWGFSKLMSNKSLTDPSNGYLVRDKLVFGAEVFVMESPPVIEHVSVLESPASYKHVLVVSNFSKLECVWNSEEFSAGDHLWKVKLYPNGNASAKGRGGVSLYIEYVDWGRYAKVMARICMCIKNKTQGLSQSGNFSTWFSSAQRNRGFPEQRLRG